MNWSRLERAIEAQREQLLLAHGVLTCLFEELVFKSGYRVEDSAVSYWG
jgi:hypothetical protein